MHPQQCLRVDRASAYHATYSAKNLGQALQNEGDHALSVISHVSHCSELLVFRGLKCHISVTQSPKYMSRKGQVKGQS